MQTPANPPLDPAAMRVSYAEGTLEASDLADTPLEQFHDWFVTATQDDRIVEPNAMVVATADAFGVPSSRTVLLKGVDERGFTFFTNLRSQKSRELQANPNVSATFPWYALHRQVVVCGVAEEISREETLAYFRSRPHESQLGAWASEQSTVIDSRDILDETWASLHDQYPPGSEVPLPEQWGGWLIRPTSIEFWQGRPSRLHDRLRFRGGGVLTESASWTVERVSP
jgi:pyridoxamine 5'-phosphate oxidase